MVICKKNFKSPLAETLRVSPVWLPCSALFSSFNQERGFNGRKKYKNRGSMVKRNREKKQDMFATNTGLKKKE